ncbi:MAG: hypothetical protein CMK33_03140 [Porticoccaceae bacterium]|nr:hypothetical protein [Porticoccaceae bacterium]
MLTSLTLVLSLTLATAVQPATAAMMGTAEVAPDVRGEQLERVDRFLAREQVRDLLLAQGVAQEDARARVAALSDTELALLSRQIDELPAGAGGLALIGAVFVILVVLEIVGVINVFKGL